MYQAEGLGSILKSRVLSAPRDRWTKVGWTIFLLGVTSLLTDVASEMVSTTLPLYMLVTLRFSPFQIGFIDGIFQGGAAVARLLGGVLADRWRRPKEVAAVGYGFSAICKLGFLIAGSSWAAISGVMLLDRVGKGIRTAPRDTMIASSSKPGQLATAFGVHRAMDTAGAMLGPLIAFGILSVAPGAYDAIFVVSFCVAIIGLAVIVLFVENPAESAPQPEAAGCVRRHMDQGGSFRSIGELLRLGEFRCVMIAGSALALVTVSDNLLYLGLQRRATIADGYFPMFYVATAMVFMVLAIPAGRLADRLGARFVFILGHVALAGVYGLLLFPQVNYLTAALMLVLLGSYYAATDGVLMALAAKVLPANLRTTGLALLTTGTGVARLIASTLYGTVWNWLGAQQALILFMGGLVLILVLVTRTMRRGAVV